MSFGGDVIVEGVVEGDVATFGGSVIQRAGFTYRRRRHGDRRHVTSPMMTPAIADPKR